MSPQGSFCPAFHMRTRFAARSSTDEHGIAKIEVTEDKHELYVKMQDYLPFQTTVEVAGDVTVKAELVWCPDPYA